MVSAAGLEPATHALKGRFRAARSCVFSVLDSVEGLKNSPFGATCPLVAPETLRELSRPAVELLQRSQPSKLTCANRRVYKSRRNAHARLCRFLSRGCCHAWFPNANLLNSSTRNRQWAA